ARYARRGRQRHAAVRGKRYRERTWPNFRKQREIVDKFKLGFVVIIADNQYENFKETIIRPFCVFGLQGTVKSLLMSAQAQSLAQELGLTAPSYFYLAMGALPAGAKGLSTNQVRNAVMLPRKPSRRKRFSRTAWSIPT